MNRNLSFINLLHEWRAMGEFASFANGAWMWRLGERAERPRSILLIPGFLAGDSTLYPFANWLRSRGHRVFFSGIMANADCPRRAVERLGRILGEQYDEGGKKLVIIGHSLGGIYARELARRFPEKVEQIILLGAPIHQPLEHANPYIVMVARLTRRLRHHSTCDLGTICGINGDAPPPGVQETLIYSKDDGIVNWSSCIEYGPNVEAVEVSGSHVGLPYNRETLNVIREKIEGRKAPRAGIVREFPKSGTAQAAS
ncbi:MAG TPA: alpha/beta fold hydrolase [Candidatus Binataceae bacterium]|nr:alpha/beta fold hydrolase [Candidatus Binataceae bacterium]